MRGNIVAIDGRWGVEGREDIEDGSVFFLTSEAGGRSGAGQRDLVLQPALPVVDSGMGRDILQRGDDEFAADRRETVYRLFALRQDRLSLFFVRMERVEQNHLLVGGILIGGDQEIVALIVHDVEAAVGDLFDDRCKALVCLALVPKGEPVAEFGVVADGEDGEAFVFGGAYAHERGGVHCIFIDKGVLGLRRSEFVVVDFLVLVFAGKLRLGGRRGVTAVCRSRRRARSHRKTSPTRAYPAGFDVWRSR